MMVYACFSRGCSHNQMYQWWFFESREGGEAVLWDDAQEAAQADIPAPLEKRGSGMQPSSCPCWLCPQESQRGAQKSLNSTFVYLWKVPLWGLRSETNLRVAASCHFTSCSLALSLQVSIEAGFCWGPTWELKLCVCVCVCFTSPLGEHGGDLREESDRVWYKPAGLHCCHYSTVNPFTMPYAAHSSAAAEGVI